MAGRGPAPKDEALRMRRNKTSTRAEVEMPAPGTTPPAPARVPDLPVRVCDACEPEPEKPKGKRGKKPKPAKAPKPCATCGGTRLVPWHWLTVAWWADLWDPAKNPFCVKYLPIHEHGLARLARIVEAYNVTGDVEYLKEIRLQGAEYGMTPRAQMGLQWQIKTPPANQGAPPPPSSSSSAGARPDPRKVLFMDQAAGGGERA